MAFYRPAAYQRPLACGLLLLLLALPAALDASGQAFYIGFATRILIFALAATSLNLVLGFGGMFSLGHAAFFGAGAYVAALLHRHEMRPPHSRLAALLHGCFAHVAAGDRAQQGAEEQGGGQRRQDAGFPLAMTVAGLLALVVGAISLRTRGVYFIMITLAFAQMTYYLFVSARVLGGDDGLPLSGRMTLAGFSLAGDAAFFLVALACLALALIFLGRLADARFGHTIQAIRENETRMEALGYPVFRYRLVCFALGGALAGLAGALLANLTGLASPNLLQWMQSGTLLVMVIIGGVGYLYGGVAGAVVLLTLEEVLAGFTLHWHLGLGLLLLAIVFFAPRGVAALLGKADG